ncbi:MAG: hypothetical protein JXB10_11280 [Pirellulales bacterium]|nr:hypothetical protein [Pirellulales bacterium]
MNGTRVFCFFALLAMGMCWSVPVHAEAIPVGSSSLIDTIDYSDTYTLTDNGGLVDRQNGSYPLSLCDYPANGTPGEGLAVEYHNGNTPRVWPDSKWSINYDSTIVAGDPASPFPGGSGGGSATGMTQTGVGTGSWTDWGIEYGVRDEFVVQYDATQSEDRIDIGIGSVLNDIFNAANLTVFIRLDNNPNFAEVSLFNAAVGEINTGLVSPIQNAYEWHNYAARFDTVGRKVEIFVDEVSLGVVDVDSVGSGAMVGVPMSNDVVNVGFSHYQSDGWLMWTDNFQVGVPVPEPGIVTLLLGALLGLVACRRMR